MARISGIDIPKNKRVIIGLTYIYGIGRKASHKILQKTKIPFDKRVNKLSEGEVANLRKTIEGDLLVEGELRTQVSMNIKRLIDIHSYRGLRHRKRLPVRGQSSKTNARTRKGKRKG